MSVKLYVGNLSYSTTNQGLNDLFARIGSVRSCSIVEDRSTGRSRGFGFVEMSSSAEAENAVAQLDGLKLDGRELKINKAEPKQPQNTERVMLNSDDFRNYSGRAYLKQTSDVW
ncbi:MAG TPA: RNA-binding protein [Pyrinomonadaceae bacterium]